MRATSRGTSNSRAYRRQPNAAVSAPPRLTAPGSSTPRHAPFTRGSANTTPRSTAVRSSRAPRSRISQRRDGGGAATCHVGEFQATPYHHPLPRLAPSRWPVSSLHWPRPSTSPLRTRPFHQRTCSLTAALARQFCALAGPRRIRTHRPGRTRFAARVPSARTASCATSDGANGLVHAANSRQMPSGSKK